MRFHLYNTLEGQFIRVTAKHSTLEAMHGADGNLIVEAWPCEVTLHLDVLKEVIGATLLHHRIVDPLAIEEFLPIVDGAVRPGKHELLVCLFVAEGTCILCTTHVQHVLAPQP